MESQNPTILPGTLESGIRNPESGIQNPESGVCKLKEKQKQVVQMRKNYGALLFLIKIKARRKKRPQISPFF